MGVTKNLGRIAESGALLDRLLHDLKQPLNTIRVVAQDIRLDIKKDRLELDLLPESISEIEEEVDRLAAQIDRLRAFARPKRSDRESASADVGEVCREVVGGFWEETGKERIVVRLDPELPRIAMASAALAQALYELLDNALLAAEQTGRAGATVELAARLRDGRVVIAVRDPGVGVPDADRARIFEPFFSTRQEAFGIGLPLASEILREAGGTLSLAETGEEGSTFEICLEAPNETAKGR